MTKRGKGRPTVTKEMRLRQVTEARRVIAEEQAKMPAGAIKRAAVRLGVAERTLQRWLADAPAPAPRLNMLDVLNRRRHILVHGTWLRKLELLIG